MYSFYGGRPGNPFIIVLAFDSVAAMVASFSQGAGYTDVHYDEHVIINTTNKNDPDNGKIYRRGYNFTNEMGGAEYIGTIVGPAGPAPMVGMAATAQIAKMEADQGYEDRYSTGQYTITNQSLVPGKTSTGTFNDAIQWASYSVRDANGEDSTAYIGFTFPYMVLEYETAAVSPYRNGQYADTSSATRADDGTHPFYEKWHLDIPKGVKGDAIKNLKVETASANIQEYTGQADDIAAGRKVLVYDYYNYDNAENGNPTKLYLGDYNMIDNVSLNDQGTLTIDYSHQDDSVFTKKIKWIQSVTLDPNGLLTVTYNHATDADGNPTTYTTRLSWINQAFVGSNGVVTFRSTTGQVYQSQVMRWPTAISINTESSSGAGEGTGNQKLHVAWNSGGPGSPNPVEEDIGNPINYIMGMGINDANHLLVRYSDPQKRINGITWNGYNGWTDLGAVNINRQAYQPNDYVSGLNWIGTGELYTYDTSDPYFSVRFYIPLNKPISSDILSVQLPPDDDAGTISGENAAASFTNISLEMAGVSITPVGLQVISDTNIPNNGSYTGSKFINISVSDMEFWFRGES